jgi:hypothetical protein
VFTACYTAIMATAAVLDAGRKDERRRNLDRQIAEAKSSLSHLLEQSAARDLAEIINSPYADSLHAPPLQREDILREICKKKPFFLRYLDQTRKNRLASIQEMRVSLGLQWNTQIPEARTATLARCEEILAAEEEELPVSPNREPQSETQMSKFSGMVNDLVARLMAEAWWTSEMQAPGSQPSPSSPDSANTMIRMLRSDGYPSYAHPDLNRRQTAEDRRRLNEVNVKILNDWAPPLRVHYVAKICYNLLVCGTPPSIENYNTLILGFSLLGEHNLAQAVVDSFLFESSLKPTHATYLCLLHHYRLKGDIVGFQGLIRRLFGYDSRGIGLQRRTAEAVAREPQLRNWVRTHDVARVNDHYVERAPFTQDLAEAMLEGFIDFGMLREGAKFVAICLAEQWAINKELLWRFFHSCLVMVDQAAANVIIRGLLDNIDQASLLLLGPDQVPHPVVRQLRHLLNIWQAIRLPNDDSADDDAGTSHDRKPRDTRKAEFDHLATAIWIRETQHYSVIMDWVLNKARQTLSDEQRPLTERLDAVLRALNREMARPIHKMKKSEKISRVAKLDWLATQLAASEAIRRQAENTIAVAVATRTPRELRTHAQFDPAVPIAKRIALGLRYATPETLAYRVAMCFELSREIDFQLKVALIGAMPRSYAGGLEQTQTDNGDVSMERVVSYFEHYLASVKMRTVKERRRERKDPFARLLEALPKPDLSFLKRAASF